MDGKTLAIVLSALLFNGAANAQNTFYKKIVNGGSNTSITQTSDGGYLLVGNLGPDDNSSVIKTYVVKLDADGSTVWKTQIGGADNFEGFTYLIGKTAFETPTGYALIGKKTSTHADFDLLLVGLARDGSISNKKVFGSSAYTAPGQSTPDLSSDQLNAVTRSRDGGFVLAGSSNDELGQQQPTILKINKTGAVAWNKLLSWNTEHQFLESDSVSQTANGGFVVAGLRFESDQGLQDIVVVKLTAGGNVSFKKQIHIASFPNINQIIGVRDGGCIVIGFLQTGSFVLKLTATGNLSWANSYDIYDIRAAVSTSDGGCVLAGVDSGGPDFQEAAFIIKMDTNGNEQWTRQFGKSGTPGFSPESDSIIQTADGGYALSGRLPKRQSGQIPDVFILKLDSTGQLQQCNNLKDFPFSKQRISAKLTIPQIILKTISYTSDIPSLIASKLAKSVSTACP